jgi:Protein of unknown function (DUF3592).
MTASWSNVSLVAGAAGGCAYSFYYIALAARAARWPAGDGEIAQTRLVRRTVDDESTDFEYVAYRYSVDGQPYRNDRVTFGPVVAPDSIVPSLDRSSRADPDLARRYPNGSPVKVHYNPSDPADSVLVPTPSLTIIVILVASLVLLSLGVRELV